MSIVANGDTGVRRTMASSLVLAVFLAMIFGQTYTSTENIAFYYLALVAGIVAYQILVRCASALLLNDITAPQKQKKATHLANLVLSCGSLIGFIWFDCLPLFAALT